MRFFSYGHFNPRSLVGNDPFCSHTMYVYTYFNPRSLVGNDDLADHFVAVMVISIHVPSWGTTRAVWIDLSVFSISIHVPSWGTTLAPAALFCHDCISIHVPSWGTTRWDDEVLFLRTFQSTFPRGERPSRPRFPSRIRLFQSTFPRGERPPAAKAPAAIANFNPRSLVGNDSGPPVIFISSRNFNPRSLVGNDGSQPFKNFMSLLFQSTFPRGERRSFPQPHPPVYVISIHVPSWGTTVQVRKPDAGLQFQSTFPRGERRLSMWLRFGTHLYFNPRSLVGNDASVEYVRALANISIHVPSWGTTANFHKYSLFFYAINIIFLLFICLLYTSRCV